MDPFDLLQGVNNDSDLDQSDSKKEKKKKVSPAALKKIQQKLAEETRQHLIKQKQEYLRETKLRVQEEWERNHAKAQVYETEFLERHQKLEYSFRRLGEIENAWEELLQQKRKFEDWEEYTKCDGLPAPSSMPEVNTYIFQWTELESNSGMDYCIKKTEEVMKLLDGLDNVIKNAGPDRPPTFVKSMKELRNRLRDLIQDNINRAIFYLLSRLETDMESINVTSSKYFAQCPYFQINLWAELYTPYPSSGKNAMLPLKVHLEEVDVVVILPAILLNIHKAIRAIWFKYDHWSDICRTYDCPPLPDYAKQNLLQLFLSENEVKHEIMNSRDILEHKMKSKIAGMPAEPTLSQEIFAWDSEPQRSLSEEITYRECTEEDDLGRQVLAMLNEFEVNLRQRTFLGDLLLVELLHVPPQPKYLRFKHNVTLRKEPPDLHPVDYYVKFPPLSEEEEEGGGEEEEIQEVREQITKRKFAKEEKIDPEEEERKKLVVIEIKPMPWIVWYETPQVAGWDLARGYWSTENIHDETYDEEEGILTFKTGSLGLFGLHVNRFCLFPFEDWLFEGNDEGGVNFYLKTTSTELNFKIKEGQVCLERMRDVPSKAMNWILENYYPPKELKELLKKGGIDVFPDSDSSTYVEGVISKQFVVETNIYQVWGLFSKKFRFKRSKFNQAVGRGKMVFQAQEINKEHQVDFCLIQTAMCSCYVLDVYENDEMYSSDPAPHMKSSVDLHTLLYENCTMNARREADVTSFLLVQTVKEFLSLLRPLSFS